MNLSRGDYGTIGGGGAGRWAPHVQTEIFLFGDFVLS